jgi:hypothetical protein
MTGRGKHEVPDSSHQLFCLSASFMASNANPDRLVISELPIPPSSKDGQDNCNFQSPISKDECCESLLTLFKH